MKCEDEEEDEDVDVDELKEVKVEVDKAVFVEEEEEEEDEKEEEEEERGEMVDKEVFEVGLKDGLFDEEFTTDLDRIVVSDFMVERTCFGEAEFFQL